MAGCQGVPSLKTLQSLPLALPVWPLCVWGPLPIWEADPSSSQVPAAEGQAPCKSEDKKTFKKNNIKLKTTCCGWPLKFQKILNENSSYKMKQVYKLQLIIHWLAWGLAGELENLLLKDLKAAEGCWGGAGPSGWPPARPPHNLRL